MSQIEQRVEINQDTLDQMRAYTTTVGCAGTISYDGPARAFILSTAAQFERYLESGIAVPHGGYDLDEIATEIGLVT